MEELFSSFYSSLQDGQSQEIKSLIQQFNALDILYKISIVGLALFLSNWLI